MNRVEIAETCARHWTKLGLQWVAVHGLEGYPESLGRDIDILVADHQRDRMAESTIGLLQANGLAVARPPDIWGTRVLGFAEGQALEIHAVSKIAWREMVLADRPRAIETVGPFPVDPWASLVKQVVLPAFAGDRSKAEMNLPGHDLAAIRQLIVDDPLAAIILDALGEAEEAQLAVAELVGRRSSLARLTRKSQPFTSAAQFGSALLSKVRPLISPSGLIVTIGGSDRRRVDEVLGSLDSGRRSVFTGVRVRRSPVDDDGAEPGWLAGVRAAWSDRRYIGQQTIVFRHVVAEDIDGSRTSAPGPHIFLDFGDSDDHPGVTVLRAGDESLQSLVTRIWHEVERLFTEAFPP